MDYTTKYNYVIDSYTTLIQQGVIKNKSDFADLLGVNRSGLSAAMNGNEKYLTDNLVMKVELALEKAKSANDATPVVVEEDNALSALAPMRTQVKCVPTIPIHAYRATNFDVMEYFKEAPKELHMAPIVMQFPATDCFYFVNSEDMAPNLRSNDLLCLSRLPDEGKVTNGDICVINTKYQGILERFIYDDNDAYILKSTQPRWTTMRIPKEEVFSIFRILGCIRTNM